MRRKLFKIILVSTTLLVLFFLVSAIFIVADGLNDEIHQADVAVVLGNTVNTDGNPSPRLQARLDKTLELYQKGFFANIIVSGGFGKEGFDEAIVMRQYLINKNIPAEAIHLDSAGNTTALTAKNSAEIMKLNNWRSALLISQYFHITRCKLAFAKYDISPVYSAHADFFEARDLYSLIREIIGFYSYFFQSATV